MTYGVLDPFDPTLAVDPDARLVRLPPPRPASWSDWCRALALGPRRSEVEAASLLVGALAWVLYRGRP